MMARWEYADYLNDYNLNYIHILKDIKATPAWRCNTRIKSVNTSTSYQGEFPSAFFKRKLSLVSCSPMLQFDEDFENYFYLINIIGIISKINI